MNPDHIYNLIRNTFSYDVHWNPCTSTDDGWKISIQGNSLENVEFVFKALYSYLRDNKIPFKAASSRRIGMIKGYPELGIAPNPEQGRKVMTIYCPDSMDICLLCEEVYSRLMDYKGWHNIKTPNGYECWACGVFFRNAYTADGKYIPARYA